jgi:two-component system, chemotaxis family, protein-glutamate methylesterase/glutaminase
LNAHVISSDSQPTEPLTTEVGRPLRVLVVDDSAFARRMITLLLQSLGVEVVGQAANGEDALLKARLIKPDAMTLDVDMPRLDGIGALKQLRQTSKLPVVLVTALPPPYSADPADLEVLREVPVVMKDFTRQSLDVSLFREDLRRALQSALKAGEAEDK